MISLSLFFPLSSSSSFVFSLPSAGCVYGQVVCYLVFPFIYIYISQIGSEGGGEQLAPWPGAMGLIIQLPPLPGQLREQTPRPGWAAELSSPLWGLALVLPFPFFALGPGLLVPTGWVSWCAIGPSGESLRGSGPSGVKFGIVGEGVGPRAKAIGVVGPRATAQRG